MIRITSIILVVLLAQWGCTKLSIPPPVVNSNAMLSVTHAAPHVPTLHFFLDNQPLRANDSLTFGNTTIYTSLNNPYVPVTQGVRKVEVGVNQNRIPSLNFIENFKAGNLYSLFILDSLANGSMKYLLITDEFKNNMSGNEIAIRFLNLSSNAPALDLFMVRWGEKDTIKIAADTRVPAGVANTTYSGNKFEYLPWGPYWMEARISGTDSVLMKGGLSAEPGSIFTIYIRGKLGSTGPYRLNVGIIEYQPE